MNQTPLIIMALFLKIIIIIIIIIIMALLCDYTCKKASLYVIWAIVVCTHYVL